MTTALECNWHLSLNCVTNNTNMIIDNCEWSICRKLIVQKHCPRSESEQRRGYKVIQRSIKLLYTDLPKYCERL